MDGVEEGAAWLEHITRDPMADAARGTVQLLAASPPTGRGRYQECRVELLAEAPEVESRVVVTTVVYDTRAWPVVGAVASARISRHSADALEVDWAELTRPAG